MIAALLAAVVIAQGGAEELWERYPLQPAPTPTPADAREQERAAPPAAQDAPADDGGMGTITLVTLIAFAATGGAVALRFAQVAARRRGAAAPASATGATPDASPPPARASAAPPGVAAPTAPARRGAAKRSSGPAGGGRPLASSNGDREAAPPAREPAPRRKPRRTAEEGTPRPARARAVPPPPATPPDAERPRTRPAAEQSAPQAGEPGAGTSPVPPSRRFTPSGSRSEWETCRVQMWRGYVSRCYVAQAEGQEAPIARSPSFRQEKGPEATAALDSLVAVLRERGWEPVTGAEGGWKGELRRRAGTPATG